MKAERIIESLLNEMANISREKSGLPWVIQSHRDHHPVAHVHVEEHVGSGRECSVMIQEPTRVIEGGKGWMEGANLRKVQEFIHLNRDALQRAWDDPEHHVEILSRIQRI